MHIIANRDTYQHTFPFVWHFSFGHEESIRLSFLSFFSNTLLFLCISIIPHILINLYIYNEQHLCTSIICGLSQPNSRVFSRFPEVNNIKTKKKFYKFTYPFCHLVLYFYLRVMKDVLNHYGNSIDNSICPLEIGFSPLIIFQSHIIIKVNLQSYNFIQLKRNIYTGTEKLRFFYFMFIDLCNFLELLIIHIDNSFIVPKSSPAHFFLFLNSINF